MSIRLPALEPTVAEIKAMREASGVGLQDAARTLRRERRLEYTSVLLKNAKPGNEFSALAYLIRDMIENPQ